MSVSTFRVLVLAVSLQAVPCCGAAADQDTGYDAQHLSHIDRLVDDAIENGDLPGCVVRIGHRGRTVFEKAYGHRQLEPEPVPMTTDTVFDLASLTKPVATATSVMILVERGLVRLRDPVCNYLPEFGTAGKDSITIEQLLTHQGGLIPDNSLSDYQDGPKLAWERIFALEPEVTPGTKFVYSDVGFLVLGELVHRVSGRNIHEFSQENIYRPLGMHETGYMPGRELCERAAATEQRDGKWLCGQVHDPRAELLGGIAGHAGLFSTAADLAIYANMLLAEGKGDGTSFEGQYLKSGVRIVGNPTVAEMIHPRDIAGNRRALGWDIGSSYSRNRGELMGPRAFGHGGFTGTAIWIDPDLQLFVIFLSNRLHPDGKGSVNDLAGRIGTIAAAAVGRTILSEPGQGEIAGQENRSRQTASLPRKVQQTLRSPDSASQSTAAADAGVLTGIDVLVRDDFQSLAGRRVGLITNHTGVDVHGKPTSHLLFEAPQVELVALFSPEHGIAGRLDVSDIDDTTDAVTGLPVYSLYGESRRPLPEHLQDIDTLVFDIQDIGTRFYTYISTMGLAMEAADEAGLRFVVLDRPNPIGGTQIAGPMLDAGSESFVGYHRLPVRHGMTIGELARMFQQQRALEMDLEVVAVEGWCRDQLWDATGLTWINPSPNMRCLTQALLYPGIGLLETTNVSVGRGTDTPFEVVGAPWIDGRRLASALNRAGLPGVRFVPVKFTPEASKHAGKTCGGVNVIVTNRDEFCSVRTGLEMAVAIRRLYPDDWDGSHYIRLLGNDAIYRALMSGATAAELQQTCRSEVGEFLNRRKEYLLYP